MRANSHEIALQNLNRICFCKCHIRHQKISFLFDKPHIRKYGGKNNKVYHFLSSSKPHLVKKEIGLCDFQIRKSPL